MQQIIAKIADILEEELTLYREMVEVSNKITDAVLEGEIKELDKLLKMQQTMIMNLNKLEDRRAGASSQLWRDDLVLTEIIENADKPLATRLQNLLKELLEVIAEQKRLNDINSKLIETNLEYIQFTLGTLTGNESVNLFDQKV